jgi:hypothetical protein
MNKVLYDVNEVKAMIAQGKKLILAGDENLLTQLPAGQWIAGTIPYFMAENGGVFTKDKIFLNELPSYVTGVNIKNYDEQSIANIYKDGPENGFSVVMMPASSPTHLSFALNAPKYDKFATNPLIGWVSGVDLKDLGQIKPKVVSGDKNLVIENGAVVMHISLPSNKYAEINIINIFKQGAGDTITFPNDGFSATEAFINGQKQNFAEYLLQKNIDIKLPLVADYCGAMVNTSFQTVDKVKKTVDFYAPVFKNIEYKLATPVSDYVTSFGKQMPTADVDKISFSCNCILNYLYSELEGKHTGAVTGPITFGEIAYQLLNQTMAYVVIGDI